MPNPPDSQVNGASSSPLASPRPTQTRKKPSRTYPLVTVAEKEAMGYERPEGVSNSKVQRRAMANRAQIFGMLKPQVEADLNREVQLIGINAFYPYDAVEIYYRTIDEPIVAGSITAALDQDGEVSEPSKVGTIPTSEIHHETVMGLYTMAYRPECNRMVEFLRTAYPEYDPLPEGYASFKAYRGTSIYFNQVDIDGDLENIRTNKEAVDAIYDAYVQNPHRTDEEWRALFKEHKDSFRMYVLVLLVLKDPNAPNTVEDAERIADEIRAHPLFSDFAEWGLFINSGTMVRDKDNFHEEIFLSSSQENLDWQVSRRQDGFTR